MKYISVNATCFDLLKVEACKYLLVLTVYLCNNYMIAQQDV
jgi:hypothetical protein